MRIFTVLVFMAAAAALGQTARLGDLGPDSTVVTNAVAGGVVVEADPLVYPIATNALALAEGALQSSWAETGTVSRATMADMLHSPRGDMWLEIDGGNTYVYEVTDSSNLCVVATGGTGYNGPPVGSAFFMSSSDSHTYFATTDNSWFVDWNRENDFFYVTSANPSFGMSGMFEGAPILVGGMNEVSLGYATFDWMPQTNAYRVALADDIPDMGGYATTVAVAAVQAEVAGKADAETVVSGAVGVATAGNRYFWTSATNVVLSVGLTGGQVVNYAALRNTGTNAITATASTSGWKWTGGSMTNSIPAGKMMTFGWAVDPSTGATNAYATAASEN